MTKIKNYDENVRRQSVQTPDICHFYSRDEFGMWKRQLSTDRIELNRTRKSFSLPTGLTVFHEYKEYTNLLF